jgi:hypothetical protein
MRLFVRFAAGCFLPEVLTHSWAALSPPTLKVSCPAKGDTVLAPASEAAVSNGSNESNFLLIVCDWGYLIWNYYLIKTLVLVRSFNRIRLEPNNEK